MKETIQELYNLQIFYLRKILVNIPEERLYETHNDMLNSAGWILGHLIVESEDIFSYLKIPVEEINYQWFKLFKGKTGVINDYENLPLKEELWRIFEERYNLLMSCYLELSDEQRESAHPSKMLNGFYINLDSWFAHHLITHVAIHCGNIATWKKIIGLKIEGF